MNELSACMLKTSITIRYIQVHIKHQHLYHKLKREKERVKSSIQIMIIIDRIQQPQNFNQLVGALFLVGG